MCLSDFLTLWFVCENNSSQTDQQSYLIQHEIYLLSYGHHQCPDPEHLELKILKSQHTKIRILNTNCEFCVALWCRINKIPMLINSWLRKVFQGLLAKQDLQLRPVGKKVKQVPVEGEMGRRWWRWTGRNQPTTSPPDKPWCGSSKGGEKEEGQRMQCIATRPSKECKKLIHTWHLIKTITQNWTPWRTPCWWPTPQEECWA